MATDNEVIAATVYLDPQENYGSLSQYVVNLINTTEGRIQSYSLNKKLCAITILGNKKAILSLSKKQHVIKITK